MDSQGHCGEGETRYCHHLLSRVHEYGSDEGEGRRAWTRGEVAGLIGGGGNLGGLQGTFARDIVIERWEVENGWMTCVLYFEKGVISGVFESCHD